VRIGCAMPCTQQDQPDLVLPREKEGPSPPNSPSAIFEQVRAGDRKTCRYGAGHERFGMEDAVVILVRVDVPERRKTTDDQRIAESISVEPSDGSKAQHEREQARDEPGAQSRFPVHCAP
jgi:hypothetical protein